MKPVQFPGSNSVYIKDGAGDLPVERGMHGETPYAITEWELTAAEREAIACGGRVQLVLHSHLIPPMAMVTVARASSGDLYIIEEGDKTNGCAVLLPAQAERLRKWLNTSRSLIQMAEIHDDADKRMTEQTIIEIEDLLADLRPLEEREVTTDGEPG